MLHFAPDSSWSLIALGLCFVLVCVFEFANGFHDTANAVATVIYTNSLKPKVAVVWSGLMNLLGVLLGALRWHTPWSNFCRPMFCLLQMVIRLCRCWYLFSARR